LLAAAFFPQAGDHALLVGEIGDVHQYTASFYSDVSAFQWRPQPMRVAKNATEA